MANPVLILMDDVHLEGRNVNEQQAFAEKVNLQIEAIKNDKNIPIVVCAGDIGEGIAGVTWASQFKAEIIYVCGNHEFWNQDFYEVIQNIKEFVNRPENRHVHFLYNNSITLEGLRFVGSTLWTSLGDFLPWISKNYVVRFYAAMGDFKKIRSHKWYTPQNENKLRQFLVQQGVEEEKIKTLIETRYFNPLLEREENYKTTEYLVKELSNEFNGQTIVVTHHLPCYHLWMKKFNINPDCLTGDVVNNERFFYEAAKGNAAPEKDILMMGFYSNDLKDLMFGEYAPDFWFHGHLHKPMSDIMGKTHVISSPVGYHKQSSEMTYKLIEPGNQLHKVANYVKKEIETYDWNQNILNNLRDLEKTIAKFEMCVSMGIMSAMDFDTILKNYQTIHDNNLRKLKNQTNEWLKLFVYALKPEVSAQDIDFFLTKKITGIMDMMSALPGKTNEPKYKFPEMLAASVSPHSFLEETQYNSQNKNNVPYHHYKEWLKELQKIQIQISQFKRTLLDYCDETLNKKA